ncbi:MAG: cobyrinate a,c-diamide synthase [Ruminococcaceae bacterium]|nr:cobyrinate a,c-diamide synthase [Oscillospiraceae bacterium]
MNDRILIAGTHSGCGKTTVTCALLQALKDRGLALQSFKCGPDYIDPMFHREVIGVPARNLDPFFSTPEQLRRQMGAAAGKLCVAEGVMGYYDGIGSEGRCSTWSVARATETPVILVVNVRGMYTSAGAVLRGFRDFRPDSGIRGVIFNNAPPMLQGDLRQIARDAGLTPLGILPGSEAAAIGSRHLGLITAGEIDDIRQRLAELGALAEKYLDIDGILALAAEASSLPRTEPAAPVVKHVRIAVARDEAFCFLYEENLQLLRELGCELTFFSPLRDEKLPEHIGGLYLPGGYPELHLEALRRSPIRRAIRQAVWAGLPTVAECGGFLYLHDTLDGAEMAGVLHAAAQTTKKLQTFGYVNLTAKRDNLLCRAGESVRAHEFHYCTSTDNGVDCRAEKPSGRRGWDCVHASDTLWAGFPHLYWPSSPAFAERFVRKAADDVAL